MKVDGYYEKEALKAGKQILDSRLHINVTNLPEFKSLIEQAEKEADQLRGTINRLKWFEVHIDFSVNNPVTSES